MDEIENAQTKIDALLASQIQSIGADALVVLHNSGQILAHSQCKDSDLATISALVAGMLSAAQSVSEIQGLKSDRSFALSHDDGESGLYTAQINRSYWIFSVFHEVLNPGLFRMNIRRLALDLRDLVSDPSKWIERKAMNEWGAEDLRRDPLPDSQSENISPEKTGETEINADFGVKATSSRRDAPKLFSDITDEEIDQLFDR